MRFLVLLAVITLGAAAPQNPPFQYKAVPAKVQYRLENPTPATIDDGQYHPDTSGAYNPDGTGVYVKTVNPYKYQAVAPVKYQVVAPVKYNAGVVRYTAEYDNSGQYVPDNSGAYNDDGQYHPDNSGAYNPDDSGRYVHTDDGYKHQGGAYVGVSGSPAPVYKPVTVSTPLKGNAVVYKDINNYGIIRKIEQVFEDGYHYVYENENGILGEEEGHLANKGQDNEYMDVKGFYRYIGPDNLEYKVDYTVDAEHGFVPRGAHIPQVPEVSS